MNVQIVSAEINPLYENKIYTFQMGLSLLIDA